MAYTGRAANEWLALHRFFPCKRLLGRAAGETVEVLRLKLSPFEAEGS